MDRAVGARIASRRAALGWSQARLATAVGVSFQQLQKYESGLNRVSASRLHRIAGVLGAPVADFFPDPSETPSHKMDTPPLSREARGMLAAFTRIQEAPVRRALVQLVQTLAA